MPKEFDWKKIEKLHKASIKEVEEWEEKPAPLTLKAIEEITWELTFNEELKTGDADGDLVTIIKTTTPEPESKNIVHYIRRSKPNDTDGVDDGTYEFTLELDEPVESEE